MRPALISRLVRLEAQAKASRPFQLRYGWLKPLPKDYTGERHVVIVKRQPTTSSGCEWCESEERPGPVPPGSEDDDAFTVYMARDDMNPE